MPFEFRVIWHDYKYSALNVKDPVGEVEGGGGIEADLKSDQGWKREGYLSF